jgi:ATP-dependent DNA helicase RecG
MTNQHKYPDREGRQLEFKAELPNYNGFIRTVVAFLNDIGGLIIIGVDDGSRNLLGVSDSDADRYLETVPKVISDAVEPYAPLQICTRTIDDKTIVEVEVFPGDRKPYFVRSEGVPKGVYARIGSHTKRASSELLEDLVRAGKGRFVDNEPIADVLIENLDEHLVSNFYRGSVPDLATLRAEKILAPDAVTRRDYVTVAGIILFHPTPRRVFPAAEVLFTEFAGTSMDSVLRTVDLSGPLSSMIVQIMDLVEPHLTLATKRTGPKLVASEFSIPPLAIREALVNALIHRRYSVVAPVKVALFKDRLEIFSPGNFPGPIDLKDLGNGVSYYRNPTIASLARRFGLVEKRGLGFYNILKFCNENRNPIPDIIQGSDYVKVALYRARGNQESRLPNDLAGLEQLREQRIPLTTSTVKQLLEVSAGTARERIQHLVALGLVEERGKGRATRYVWK